MRDEGRRLNPSRQALSKLARCTPIANNRAPMRILVTGADGFVGGHLARLLAQAGHHVFSSVYARAARAGEVRVDLSQPDQLRALPAQIDAVVHAAGNVDPRKSMRVMSTANVLATQHLSRWAHDRGCRHFVHLSSVAVYGPLTLGEQRSEHTPRLGRVLGLPYMRTKAQAEYIVEQSGLPYTLLRLPAVLGAGDTVVSRGFIDALARGGMPMIPGASMRPRVSLVFAAGVADIVARLLAHGPLRAPLHAVDVELGFGELAQAFERALGQRLLQRDTSRTQALLLRNEVGLAWLIASSRFGQHYLCDRLVSTLGYRSAHRLDSTIEAGLSGLQGGNVGLF